MKQLIITVIGGVLIAVITTFFGIGKTTQVVVGGNRVKKTGKWIIIVSALMIFSGFYIVGYNTPPQGGIDFNKPGIIYGLTLAGYGLMALLIGRIVAWFQQN